MRLSTLSLALSLVSLVGCAKPNAGILSAQNTIIPADLKAQTVTWYQSNQADVAKFKNLPIKSYIDHVIADASNSALKVNGIEVSGVRDYLQRNRALLQAKFAGHETLGAYLKAKKFNPKELAYFEAMLEYIDGEQVQRLMAAQLGANKKSLALDAADTDASGGPFAGGSPAPVPKPTPAPQPVPAPRPAPAPVSPSSGPDSAACDKINKADLGLTIAGLVPYVGRVAALGSLANQAAGIAKGCNGGPGLCDTLVDCNKPVSQMSSMEYAATLGTLAPLPIAGPLSDLRLKDILGDYAFGLEAVKKLHTVRFKYKKDNPLDLPTTQEYTGFIAQELQQVIPPAVVKRPDGFLQVDFLPVHWATVNAVRELAAENAKLRGDVAALKGETAALKKLMCVNYPGEDLCKTP